MSFLDLFLGALLAMLATSLGAVAIILFRRIKREWYPAIISFCAGVMTFSAVEMIIESHNLSDDTTVFIGLVCGLLAVFALERILPHTHTLLRKSEISGSKKKTMVIAGTITLHNIPEGFAIASAFATSSPLGWLVALSISIQDIPEGFMISAPLNCYGVNKIRSILYGVFSGVVEFAAAIVGYLLLSIAIAITPIALAFSAGAMLYVVFFELLLDALKSKAKYAASFSFILGILIAFGVASILGL